MMMVTHSDGMRQLAQGVSFNLRDVIHFD